MSWRERFAGPAREPVDVLLFFDLQQDVDVLAPLAAACRGAGLSVAALVSRELLSESPRAARGVPAFRSVARQAVLDGDALPFAAEVLVTAAESTANPHAVAHALTRRANWEGVTTCTLQHGLENVGLTYCDARFPPGAVRFASQVVFTWGEASRLHPETPVDVRRRCLPVGCPKPARPAGPSPVLPGPDGRRILVLENLHWERYDQGFRAAFEASLRDLAAGLPDAAILLKPHHAGRWASERRRGPALTAPNLHLLDPRDPTWEPYTAPAVIAACEAVITTPSTVALDAARLGVPTAVVADRPSLPTYDPLPLVRDAASWIRFAERALDPDQRDELVQRATAFVDGAVLAGDGAEAIATHLAAECRHRRAVGPTTDASDSALLRSLRLHAPADLPTELRWAERSRRVATLSRRVLQGVRSLLARS